MNALIAEVTVRVPILNDLREEDQDDSVTDTERHPVSDRRLHRRIQSQRNGKHDDGNDTTDSGVLLSDGQ